MGREMAWSKKELDILKKNHGFLDAKKIVEMINENCRQGMTRLESGFCVNPGLDTLAKLSDALGCKFMLSV